MSMDQDTFLVPTFVVRGRTVLTAGNTASGSGNITVAVT